MQNQNRKIRNIDERPKGKSGIKEMLDRMFKTDENGNPEENVSEEKETA